MENENIKPATAAELDSFVKQMQEAFPKTHSKFFALVRERAERLGFSRKRLQFIMHKCIDEGTLDELYQFDRLTPAAILKIKPAVEYLDYQEAVSPANFSRVVRIFDVPKYPQKYHLCLREDAEKTDFPFEGFV